MTLNITVGKLHVQIITHAALTVSNFRVWLGTRNCARNKHLPGKDTRSSEIAQTGQTTIFNKCIEARERERKKENTHTHKVSHKTQYFAAGKN